MTRLSKQTFWDQVYVNAAKEAQNTNNRSGSKKIVRFFKRLLGSYAEYYSDYLLWEVLLKTHLPSGSGLKALEVGSAPGDNLVELYRKFGYTPYGVEYSETGVKLNQQTFSAAGINPENVIHADFFSEEFLSRYKEAFDMVCSGGFIEHFTNIEEVIDNHLALLKPGGTLVISIPRLTGINNLLTRFFNQENLAIHNLNIMNRKTFSGLFDVAKLQPLYCDYFGTFSLRLCEPKEWHGFKYRLMRLTWWIQIPLNVLFRLAFGNKGMESYFFSPYLIYFGTKK
jgi:2-polyprenyl-3-methyl-5-hydroxy-6-metoxy-1,4-benzoquinol methylase